MGKSVRATRKRRSQVSKTPRTADKARKFQSHSQRSAKVAKSIVHPVMRKNWDRKKTLKQNFRSLGLVQDPNFRASLGGEAKFPTPLTENEQKSAARVGSVLDDIVASKPANPGRLASSGMIDFVEALVEKHGSDFVAMARDHKLNCYQHTPKQIKNKVLKVHSTLERLQQHIDEGEAEAEAEAEGGAAPEEEMDQDEDEDEDDKDSEEDSDAEDEE